MNDKGLPVIVIETASDSQSEESTRDDAAPTEDEPLLDNSTNDNSTNDNSTNDNSTNDNSTNNNSHNSKQYVDENYEYPNNISIEDTWGHSHEVVPTNEILTKEMRVEKICDNLSKRQRKLGTCPYNQNKHSLSNDDVSTSENMDMLDGSASPKSLNARQRS